MNDSILCLACGLADESVATAKKAQRFLSASLAAREIPQRYFPGISEAEREVYLALAAVLIPGSSFVAPGRSVAEHLLRALPRHRDHYRLFFVVCGAWDEVRSESDLDSAQSLHIQHPDRFAYFLAQPSRGPEATSVIQAFLHRYARICVGVSRGLGTPVDFLTAASAAFGPSLDTARFSALLSACEKN